MALNKNALIRYKTIDKCLQNRYKKWTLEDLINACSDALYEFEGKNTTVSTRTVQLDIQMMRSNKLGYDAPIVVYDKKYYKYEDEDFTITDIPLNESDMNVLSETVEVLKQFKDFSLFSELGGIIQRLEDKIYTEKTHQAPIIHLDKNENLKGLEHLDILYQAIVKKIVLKLTYQSFKSRKADTFNFHGFILKEFNNRWFIVGRKGEGKVIQNLALDRIQKIEFDLNEEYLDEHFNGDNFYKNTIGVTVLREQDVAEVVLKIDQDNAPYVLTKPFHKSQELIDHNKEDGSITIKLQVHPNFELERLILGFGDSIEVIAPARLRRRIKTILQRALNKYQEA